LGKENNSRDGGIIPSNGEPQNLARNLKRIEKLVVIFEGDFDLSWTENDSHLHTGL